MMYEKSVALDAVIKEAVDLVRVQYNFRKCLLIKLAYQSVKDFIFYFYFFAC